MCVCVCVGGWVGVAGGRISFRKMSPKKRDHLGQCGKIDLELIHKLYCKKILFYLDSFNPLVCFSALPAHAVFSTSPS